MKSKKDRQFRKSIPSSEKHDEKGMLDVVLGYVPNPNSALIERNTVKVIEEKDIVQKN